MTPQWPIARVFEPLLVESQPFIQMRGSNVAHFDIRSPWPGLPQNPAHPPIGRLGAGRFSQIDLDGFAQQFPHRRTFHLPIHDGNAGNPILHASLSDLAIRCFEGHLSTLGE